MVGILVDPEKFKLEISAIQNDILLYWKKDYIIAMTEDMKEYTRQKIEDKIYGALSAMYCLGLIDMVIFQALSDCFLTEEEAIERYKERMPDIIGVEEFTSFALTY